MSHVYRVIDADAHILEPLDLWDNYIEPKFRDRAPRIVKGENGKEQLVIEEHAVGDGQLGIGRIGAVGARQGIVSDTIEYAEGKPGGFDPHKRIPDMDADGIDAAFLYPSLGLFAGANRSSRPRPVALTTVGWPITASRILTASSASRCCRCGTSTWRLPRCVTPARSSACVGAS